MGRCVWGFPNAEEHPAEVGKTDAAMEKDERNEVERGYGEGEDQMTRL